MITINNTAASSEQLARAMKSGDEAELASAWEAFGADVAERVRADYADARHDTQALADRGYRTLTTAEERWYNNLSTALKAKNPKQAFIDIFEDDDSDEIMPETILEDVMRYVEEEHPLIGAVDTHYVNYATKWIVSDNAAQYGSWGRIDEAITTEVTGSLKVIDLTQAKYSAYCVIPLDLLDMGPTYLDSYIRTILAQAVAYGLEDAIVNGTGVNMPIGITRDPDGDYSSTDGYPEKEAVELASFMPADYGAVIADNILETAAGKTRNFDHVDLVCNPKDYYSKIMPATTLTTDSGQYAHDVFPVETKVYKSVAVEEGTAILGILDDYTLAVGGSRNGTIEYDDSIGFLDDTRTFRVVQHAAGRAFDATSFVTLDIENVETPYVTVKDATETVTA